MNITKCAFFQDKNQDAQLHVHYRSARNDILIAVGTPHNNADFTLSIDSAKKLSMILDQMIEFAEEVESEDNK